MICRILILMFVFPSLVMAADIDKLGKQCAAGDNKACTKLVEIAKGSKDSSERKSAAEVLVNQQLLSDLARTAVDALVRTIAASKATNQAVLADIVRLDADPSVRAAAIRNMKDQTVLNQAARSDSDREVRIAATKAMTDQDMLTNLLKTSNDNDLRKAAVVKLTDQMLLEQIAKTEADPKVRAAAIGMSKDESFLTSAIANDDRTVRIAAAGRLEDLTIERIKREGPGDRFVIKEIVPGPSEEGKGRICFAGNEKDGVSIGGLYAGDGSFMFAILKVGQEPVNIPAGARGSVHRFLGKVGLGKYTFVGESDETCPLTFLLLGDGYTYVRGKGTVTFPDGTIVKLGNMK